MDKPKITTLETARMLDDTTALLGDIAGICDYLKYSIAMSHDEIANGDIFGIFGVLAYAAGAAHAKQADYLCEFMNVCGFNHPLQDNCPETNIQRDTAIPFTGESV